MEWKEITLGEIAIFKTGKLNSNAAISNGEYPFFTCSPETLRINNYAFDQEAILLAGNNADGNFSIKYYKGKFNAYQRTYVITPIRGKVDIKFLYYALSLCLKQFKNMSQGTSTKFLTVTILNSFSVQLPSISDQRRIASILSSLDRKIELNNKINADLEEMAQAIFKNWFVDFEPFKDGKFVDSELGMIPEGWKVGCLGDIAEITSGKRPPKKSKDKTKELFIPLIGASDIMGFTSDVLYERPILVIGRVGTHGVVQRFQEKCWPSDNTLVIESSYYNYVYQLLKGIDYSAINRGSTQPLITQTDVKNTDVIIAPENVLKEYESITSTLFSKHRANIKENSRLSTLRDTLLPRLMSGELEVPE